MDTPVWALKDEEKCLELLRRQGGKLQARRESPQGPVKEGQPHSQKVKQE